MVAFLPVHPQNSSKHSSRRACVVNHCTNGRSAFLYPQNSLKYNSRCARIVNHFANGRSAFLRPQNNSKHASRCTMHMRCKSFLRMVEARSYARKNDSKHDRRRACFANQFASGRSTPLRPQNDWGHCQSARMLCKIIWM